jgi:glycosyltransferase involved in cell wall biosynthesis
MENRIMVSVDMITFKHENYIAQAIEGVLMQKTNFEFELIICDDCSPGGTEEIVRSYIEKHPQGNRIKYFRHEVNIGMQPNGIFAAKQCNGKYIAICEGDDYWTDPLKLQKQVDFLEANEDFSVCGTYCDVLRNNGLEKRNTKDFISFNYYEIIKKNPIPTLTLCFRNFLINYDSLLNYRIGDIPLLLELTRQGFKGAKLPFNSAVYRYHGCGANSGNTRFQNINLQIETKFLYFIRNTDNEFNFFLRDYLVNLIFQEIKLFLKLEYTIFNFKIIYISLVYYFRVFINYRYKFSK